MILQHIRSILEYLLVLMVILEFNTPYTYFPVIGKMVTLSIITLSMFLILLNWKNLSIDFFAFVLLITIGAIFPFFNVYEGKTIAYIKLYFVILPLLLILTSSYMSEERESVSHLFIKFSNIVAVIAIISLFFWFLGSTLELIPSTAIIPNSWAGDRFIPTYFGVYFETQEAMATSGAESMIRNSGIFNEAPMYNMILCTALSIEMFLHQKISVKRIILLTLTILSTISTTGGVFMFIVYAIKAYNSFASNYKLQMILLLPIFILMGVFSINNILDNKKETGEYSYNSRSHDIVKCIEVGIENPIAGVGIMYKAAYAESNFFGFSNSLFGVFAHGGFYFLLLYLFPFLIIPLILLLKYKNSSIGGIFLSYFGVFSFTVSEYKVLTIFVIACSLSYWYFVVFKKRNNIISVTDF